MKEIIIEDCEGLEVGEIYLFVLKQIYRSKEENPVVVIVKVVSSEFNNCYVNNLFVYNYIENRFCFPHRDSGEKRNWYFGSSLRFYKIEKEEEIRDMVGEEEWNLSLVGSIL